MAVLPTRSFNTIVNTIVAGIQGRASALIDFTVGSPLLAITEAIAGVALWLQAFALQVLTVARLSTSVGSDVDSFVNDFGVTRLGASTATGVLTFSRLTASSSVPFVPVGTTVQTADGTTTVTVVADTTNANFSLALNGYSMPSGVTTLSVTAQAGSPGTAGNIAAGTATVLTTPIVGIDQVTNTLAFTGGQVAETDAALKIRFVLFILGLSQGNLFGIESALANLNVSIAFKVTDQMTTAGVSQPGFFFVNVDDGSGSPPQAFLNAASNAVNAHRALGVNFSVFPPTLVTANVSMIISAATGFNATAVAQQVAAVINANILALGLGAGLPFSLLPVWAFSVMGVTNATAITLNGGTADIAANNQNRVMPGTITVS
jgi:phage-related baseplate assembly protein